MQTLTKQQMKSYDFPVTLQKAFTAEGYEVPRARAVVREDTKQPIAVVSSSYRLITHTEIVDRAMDYVKAIGKADAKFHMHANGAKMLAEFTFLDKTLAVRKNEMVGLRVYVDNNYTAKGSMKVRIGGLCMWCLNGAINHQDVFDISVPHIGNAEIIFPEPKLVMDSFAKTIGDFKRLTAIRMSDIEMVEHVQNAADSHILPRSATKHFVAAEDRKEQSAWGLYNFFTNVITHKMNSRSTEIGRIKRLNNVGRWFGERFLGETGG